MTPTSASIDPIDLLERAVRIPSHESVEKIRDLLLDRISGASVDESGCVVAQKGEGSPHVVLNTHMDVVPPHVEFERDGDVIRGRGACDAKSSLAAMASAFSAVSPSELRGAVTLVISPDEETTSTGLYEYVETSGSAGREADMAVVGEPTGLDVCPAARGRFEVVVEFEGEAAHAASNSGMNAVSCAAEGIERLESMEEMHDELLGESKLTITRIEGGEADNQVPESASFFVDRRSVPPETQDEFLEKVETQLQDLECNVNVRFSDRPTPFLEAFRTDSDVRLVQELVDAGKRAGISPPPSIRPFDAATEASYLARHMPVTVFGPGLISENIGGVEKAVAHSKREYVEVHEVEKATEALTVFLLNITVPDNDQK